MLPLQVICVHDVSSIYKVPLLLEDQGVVGYFSRRLDMPIEGRPRKMLAKWKEMSNRWVVRSAGVEVVFFIDCYSSWMPSPIWVWEGMPECGRHGQDGMYVMFWVSYFNGKSG